MSRIKFPLLFVILCCATWVVAQSSSGGSAPAGGFGTAGQSSSPPRRRPQAHRQAQVEPRHRQLAPQRLLDQLLPASRHNNSRSHDAWKCDSARRHDESSGNHEPTEPWLHDARYDESRRKLLEPEQSWNLNASGWDQQFASKALILLTIQHKRA